ncbi:hypothetical protein DFH06DRAFT_1148259 [Mycena polygramma]|nr:hypothetical protein DFH06DRAFT_1148259 [Mycena polygramma]
MDVKYSSLMCLKETASSPPAGIQTTSTARRSTAARHGTPLCGAGWLGGYRGINRGRGQRNLGTRALKTGVNTSELTGKYLGISGFPFALRPPFEVFCYQFGDASFRVSFFCQIFGQLQRAPDIKLKGHKEGLPPTVERGPKRRGGQSQLMCYCNVLNKSINNNDLLTTTTSPLETRPLRVHPFGRPLQTTYRELESDSLSSELDFVSLMTYDFLLNVSGLA